MRPSWSAISPVSASRRSARRQTTRPMSAGMRLTVRQPTIARTNAVVSERATLDRSAASAGGAETVTESCLGSGVQVRDGGRVALEDRHQVLVVEILQRAVGLHRGDVLVEEAEVLATVLDDAAVVLAGLVLADDLELAVRL